MITTIICFMKFLFNYLYFNLYFKYISIVIVVSSMILYLFFIIYELIFNCYI